MFWREKKQNKQLVKKAWSTSLSPKDSVLSQTRKWRLFPEIHLSTPKSPAPDSHVELAN